MSNIVKKGIDIPQFINHFASRLAKAMAGVLFHTQHNGIHPASAACRAAANFSACDGTTRSSVSAVVMSVGDRPPLE